MKYAILVYETAQDFATRDSDEVKAAYDAYSKALMEAGVIAGGAELCPANTGTTLFIKGGQRKVQDGPYADTKEQLGGLFIVDVPDVETALDWAARCPAASKCGVEVRPLVSMGEG
ncbi:MAG: YciI family protein [Cyanobacteria bacterium P01_A01_bin.17]